jgi:DNA-directed RNA polymerase specialized sigma24 family protein
LNNLSQVIIEYRCMPDGNLATITGELHHYRRLMILKLGQSGLNQAQIAVKLDISLSTVKREIYAIRKSCRIRKLDEDQLL